jgi:type IV secretion system protein VirD4
MKAMKNYAGHRLAPWLSHLMVSRSETARALLTPGEIMQLPPSDEIVMVAGTPPIRATKARYYEDARFTERVLPPPNLVEVDVSGEDDWSSLTVPPQDVELESVSETGPEGEDPTGSGRRLQPELAQPQPVDRQTPIENEFEFDPPEDEEDSAIRSRRILQQMRGVARQVSLNPDDGMEL